VRGAARRPVQRTVRCAVRPGLRLVPLALKRPDLPLLSPSHLICKQFSLSLFSSLFLSLSFCLHQNIVAHDAAIAITLRGVYCVRILKKVHELCTVSHQLLVI
jgi:hypothetical protein